MNDAEWNLSFDEATERNEAYIFPRNFRKTGGFHFVNPGCMLQDGTEIFHNGYHNPDPCPNCGKIRFHGEKDECLKCIRKQTYESHS